jgi:hypothetical protein
LPDVGEGLTFWSVLEERHCVVAEDAC